MLASLARYFHGMPFKLHTAKPIMLQTQFHLLQLPMQLQTGGKSLFDKADLRPLKDLQIMIPSYL